MNQETAPSFERVDDKIIKYSFWITIPIFLYLLLGAITINTSNIFVIVYATLFLIFYIGLLVKNEFYKHSKLFLSFSVFFAEIYFLAYYLGLFSIFKNYYNLTLNTQISRIGEAFLVGAIVLLFSLGISWLVEKIIYSFLSDENKTIISQLPNPKLNPNLILRKELLFAIVGAIIIFFITYVNFAGLSLQQQVIENEIPIPISLDQESVVFKTYTNTTYNFGLSYPASWVIEEDSGYPFGIRLMPREFQQDKRDMLLEISPLGGLGSELFSISAGVKLVDAIFAGRQAKMYECPDIDRCPLQFTYSKAIQFSISPSGWEKFGVISFSIRKGYEDYIAIYNQVLSSFQFNQ